MEILFCVLHCNIINSCLRDIKDIKKLSLNPGNIDIIAITLIIMNRYSIII